MTHNIIISEYDENCEMARVILNENCVMEGNHWDFHPGCHGIHKWGDFKSPVDLVAAIKRTLEEKGETVEVIAKEYKYEN